MSTPFPFDFPVIIGAQGAVPTTPAAIQAQVVASATAQSPGYTSALPGILIEDISSTVTAAAQIQDQARVDTINSLTPYAANVALLYQLGQVYGVQLNQATNTSVGVVFTGTSGYIISAGFLVSDGTYTYAVQNGGVIQSGAGGVGTTPTLTAIAIQTGSWGVPAGSVTQLLTSVPAQIQLSVTNPATGTPAQAAQTWMSYRTQCLQAGLATGVGTGRYIKTQLGNVQGVTPNLVSVIQATAGALTGAGIRVCASGGDVYAIAYAILIGVADPTALVGSSISASRNVTVSLIDPPNIYSVVYVNTPIQTVTMVVTWNTILPNFTGGASFASLVAAVQSDGTPGPLVAYINALGAGQPINVLDMDALFQDAVSTVLNPAYLTRLVFGVYINGVLVPQGSGNYVVTGDPESAWFTATDGTGISVVQG